MIRLWGAVCLLVGCVLPAVQVVRQQRGYIRRLGGLADSLESLRRQLAVNTPEMGELLASAAQSKEEEIREFYQQIPLEELEERPFSALWDRAMQKSRLQLEPEEAEIFSSVGRVLGQYPWDEQCRQLDAAAQALRRCQSQHREGLQSSQRLWYTLSLSVGLLGAIILY